MSGTGINAGRIHGGAQTLPPPGRGLTASDRRARVEIVFLLALSALTLFAVVRLERQVASTSPPALRTLPRGFVWGGRTFVDLKSFSHWLRARGYDYELWAKNHPHRAGLRPLPAARPQQAASPRSGRSPWAAWLVAAGGFGFVASVLTLRRRRLHRPARARRRRAGSGTVLKAVGGELGRLGGDVAAAVKRTSGGERGELFLTNVDWPALAQRLAHRGRSVRRHVARASPDVLWYCVATVLAVSMGLAVAFWA